MISVVVPVYNEEKSIGEAHRRIVKAMTQWKESYEIIFVNDGSSDGTLKEMQELKPLKIISHQTNYGQTPAIYTGIQHSQGEIIVLIDADLQNDPAEITLFLEKIFQGCDVVVGRRQNRRDKRTRLLFSKIANFIAGLLLGVKVHDFGCGLKAYRREFVKDFYLWGEVQVFLPAVAKARGAKICEVTVKHYPRKFGSSKIRISKMARGVLDLMIMSFLSRRARRIYKIKEIIDNK